MVKSLEHPNVIKYFDIEVSSDENEITNSKLKGLVIPSHKTAQIDIIMEYLEGVNLKDFLTFYSNEHKSKGLPLEIVIYITEKVLQGLKYLHENKIIHRDLKVIFTLLYSLLM